MNAKELALDRQAQGNLWQAGQCDKNDYMIAAFCGFAAGIVDALFVRAPGAGRLGRLTDRGADAFVQKVAVMLWKGDGRTTMDGKPKKAPDTLERSISYLEQSFPVNYDARYAPDLQQTNGALANMTPKNHHLLSLAHSPDIIGLLFSILDQFTGQASFAAQGRVIRLYPVRDARDNKVMYMQGTNLHAKIFCGICNWLGHLASDLCGSGSTRRAGKTGRGAGLPVPFYELFLFMNFQSSDGTAFAELAVRVFEEGYDLRHGAAMAVPVMIAELSVKLIWILKRRFHSRKEWRDCVPSASHADLRMMLLISDAALCLTDGMDAAIRAALQGGSLLTFVLHLNLAAWARLLVLVFQELRIRCGSAAIQAFDRYLSVVGLNDKYALQQYNARMRQYDLRSGRMFREFVLEADREYRQFADVADRSLNPARGTPETRMRASVGFARQQGVSERRIIQNTDKLDAYMRRR